MQPSTTTAIMQQVMHIHSGHIDVHRVCINVDTGVLVLIQLNCMSD